jgi:peptidoglycan LD-endopeptidase CwlK
MAEFSKSSLIKLEQCAKPLQLLFNAVVKSYDCTILCGHRSEEEQNQAFAEGKSKLRFPDSKHNLYPSIAVDVAPYPINWEDVNAFYFFAGLVFSKAHALGIDKKLRWGGDWNGNRKFKDETFKDLVHWEIIP